MKSLNICGVASHDAVLAIRKIVVVPRKDKVLFTDTGCPLNIAFFRRYILYLKIITETFLIEILFSITGIRGR